MIRCAFALMLALLIAGCGGADKPVPAADQRGAAGDVQPGSISDAMIPLDTVRSQSPPLKIAPSDAARGAGAADAGPTEAAVPAPDAAPASAAAPSPAASAAGAAKN